MTENSLVVCKNCKAISVIRELRKLEGLLLYVAHGKTAESGYGFCRCNVTDRGALVFFLASEILLNEEFAEPVTLQASAW